MRTLLYARQDDHNWLLSEATSANETIALKSIQCQLALEEIYRKVQFKTEDSIKEELWNDTLKL